jgi:hypothetical protein
MSRGFGRVQWGCLTAIWEYEQRGDWPTTIHDSGRHDGGHSPLPPLGESSHRSLARRWYRAILRRYGYGEHSRKHCV